MSETATMTLTEFLLARVAEDEDATMNASHHSQLVRDFERDNYGFLWVKTTRVLAECEAKRRIVEEAADYVSEYENESWRTEDGFTAGRVAGRARSWRDDILRALALPYADHPDYREEWRP